jgi:two-component system response regulator
MRDETLEVLLVEDSPDDAAFFIRAFEKTGLRARVHVAADGRQALDFVYGTGGHAGRNPANRPRVIFLDLKLPKIGGLEILRRLKGDPSMRSIPIVVLSSSQEERDLIESYALCVNSYVVKPMDLDQLTDSVRIMGQYWLQFNQTINTQTLKR